MRFFHLRHRASVALSSFSLGAAPKRPVLVILMSAASVPLLIAPVQAENALTCLKGPSEPKSPIIPKIRPIQTVKCNYDVDVFIQRLIELAADTHSLDTIEPLREAFHLPDITTGYDHRRIAAYAADISGAGGWSAKLGVTEAFFPLQTGPARFVPGAHPKRLGSASDASLQIDVSLAGQQSSIGVAVQCVSPRLRSVLLREGWKEDAHASAPSSRSSTRIFHYGSKSVSIDQSCTRNKPQLITLSQKPAVPG